MKKNTQTRTRKQQNNPSKDRALSDALCRAFLSRSSAEDLALLSRESAHNPLLAAAVKQAKLLATGASGRPHRQSSRPTGFPAAWASAITLLVLMCILALVGITPESYDPLLSRTPMMLIAGLSVVALTVLIRRRTRLAMWPRIALLVVLAASSTSLLVASEYLPATGGSILRLIGLLCVVSACHLAFPTQQQSEELAAPDLSLPGS